MNKFFNLLGFLFALFVLLTTTQDCSAQHKKIRHRTVKDSLRRAMLKRDSLMRTFKQSDISLNSLLQKIEYYNSYHNQDFADLAQGFDTLEIHQKLPVMEKRMALIEKIIDNDHTGTLGYYFTIRDLLSHFKDDLDSWQEELAAAADKLNKTLADAAEFKKDSVMHTVPKDSILKAQCLAQIIQVGQKWKSLDTVIQKSLIKIGLLQNRVTTQDLLLLDVNDRIDLKIHNFAVKSLTNEYGFLWQNDKKNLTPFDTVTAKTIRLNSKLLKFFFDPATTAHVNIVSHVATVLVFVLFLTWIYASRRKLKRLKDHHQATAEQTNYVAANSVVSALICAAILALYLYDQPPFVFLEIVLLVMTICAGILIKPVWPKLLFRFWCLMTLLLLLYGIVNLFMQVSYAERLIVAILSIVGILAGLWFLSSSKAAADKYPAHAQLFVKIFVGFHAISLLLNVFGRFSISKLLGVTAVFNFCLSFGFYLFIQILMESLFLQLEANKNGNSRFSSYIDFKILQNKFKSVLIVIAIVLWTVKLLENLDIDDYVYNNAGTFLSHPYKIGTAIFTFGSIVIFVFVNWVAILISRVISYFYDYAEQQSNAAGDIKKNRTSMLLIRLSVFSVGFIAAIALSGIPLTEVTIVIGALGVGIGFGLQNIVNNLVSGVILAFEKPVQVGDIIEVGNQSGTIKEIGIRATKIEAGDGSELIVPNGDLISQHVTNWTLTNNNRRVELIVGVAYGSDIAKVESLLKRIVRERDDIMQTPAPLVFLHNFSDSSVDFRLLFWAADINKWTTLKSNVMSQIYMEFAKEGVEIPHPKRDIQVFFPDGTSAEIKNPESTKGRTA